MGIITSLLFPPIPFTLQGPTITPTLGLLGTIQVYRLSGRPRGRAGACPLPAGNALYLLALELMLGMQVQK